MFASSKTITNERSPRTGGIALVEMRCRPDGTAAGDSPKTTASKAETVWGRPSSLTVKSAWVRPSTGLPWRSRTTTSTFTTSTPEGNAVDAWAVAGGWVRASPSGAPAVATARASSAGVRTFVRTRGSPILPGMRPRLWPQTENGGGIAPAPESLRPSTSRWLPLEPGAHADGARSLEGRDGRVAAVHGQTQVGIERLEAPVP